MREVNAADKAALAAWCKSYVTAFSAYDAAGIEAHWAFPALIIHDGARTPFKSAEHFTRNTSALLSFYERQGVAQAERKLISCMSMGDGAASIVVHDRMLNSTGGEIVTWQAAYVLQRIDGDWRAVFAIADGEKAAWNKRGTPLGS